MNVIPFTARSGPKRRPSYSRPMLPWVRRRARRLQEAFGIDRHQAVAEAARHYVAFTRRPVSRVQLEEVTHG